jgi:serine/threonine protein kinase
MTQPDVLKFKSEQLTKIVCPETDDSTVAREDNQPSESALPDVLPDAPNDDVQLLSVLGAGGMGVVYKAQHLKLGQTVAVKMLHSRLAGDSQLVKRFEQEAKSASLLTHEHLAAVYDYGISKAGVPYLIMDYIEGQTLQDLLKHEGVLDTQRFVKIFKQVCDALAHAHEKQLVHRDLKPANIMLANYDEQTDFVKVVDFGIAKILPQAATDEERLTQTGEVLGSPVYMCPEQCMGHPPDARGDIYSLGCVMYEMLTGRPPFLRDNVVQTILSHLKEQPLPFAEGAPHLGISRELEKVVFKCLEKEPNKRYQTIEELKESLELIDQDTSMPSKQFVAARQRKAKLRNLLQRRGSSIFIGMSAVFTLAAIGTMFLIKTNMEKAFASCVEAAELSTHKYNHDRGYYNYGLEPDDPAKDAVLNKDANEQQEAWKKAIGLAENLHKSYKTLGRLYYELGKSYDKSAPPDNASLENSFKKAIGYFDRSQANRFEFLSMTQGLIDHYPEQTHLGNPGKIDETNNPARDALLTKGAAALKANQSDLAAAYFTDALKRDRNSNAARNGLARVLEHHAERAPVAEKLKLLHQAAYLANDDGEVHRLLNEAIKSMDKNPDSYSDRIAIAEAALKSGDIDGAIIEYDAALQMQPSAALLAKVQTLCLQKINFNEKSGRGFYNDYKDELISLILLTSEDRAFAQTGQQSIMKEFRQLPAYQPLAPAAKPPANYKEENQLLLARCMFRKARWAEAEFAFKQLLLVNPEIARDGGEVSWKTSDGKQVQYFYRNPLPELADVLLKRGKPDEAATCLKILLQNTYNEWGPGPPGLRAADKRIQILEQLGRESELESAKQFRQKLIQKGDRFRLPGPSKT